MAEMELGYGNNVAYMDMGNPQCYFLMSFSRQWKAFRDCTGVGEL